MFLLVAGNIFTSGRMARPGHIGGHEVNAVFYVTERLHESFKVFEGFPHTPICNFYEFLKSSYLRSGETRRIRNK
jgi:hypothetical protein